MKISFTHKVFIITLITVICVIYIEERRKFKLFDNPSRQIIYEMERCLVDKAKSEDDCKKIVYKNHMKREQRKNKKRVLENEN